MASYFYHCFTQLDYDKVLCLPVTGVLFSSLPYQVAKGSEHKKNEGDVI